MALTFQYRKQNEEKKEKLVPLIVTFFYFSLLLILLFFLKLSSPVPLEEGAGLLVDFGYTEAGLGESEPDAKNPMNNVSIPSPGNPPFTQSVKERVLVQDEEESEKAESVVNPSQKIVVVQNVLKSKVTSDKKTATPNNNPVKTSTEKNKVDENLIYKGPKGTGTGDGSQGNTKGDGNMGDPSGSKSDNYLGKSTGLGSEGEGRGRIGSGLVGRKLSSIPGIVDNSNKTGKIIIKVNVGSSGNVIAAEYKAQGSTITDSDLVNKCKNAAKKAKFTASNDNDSDWGTLVFIFEIQ